MAEALDERCVYHEVRDGGCGAAGEPEFARADDDHLVGCARIG